MLAKTRTGNLWTQLAKEDALLKSYETIFKEFLQERIIEKGSNIPNEGYVHYLRHQPVIRNNRERSKIRIVFDASTKSKNEKSLNDVADPGPSLLPLLFNILLRFWTGKIGLIVDIKQAFLQIEVAPEHRDFLRFMWFIDVFKSHPEFISLRFTRLLFGLTCRPFLLNGTIKSDLLKYTQFTDIKKFIEKLLHNLYVDDSVNRFDKLNDCIKFYKVPKPCLTDAGFDLRTAKYVVIIFKNVGWYT